MRKARFYDTCCIAISSMYPQLLRPQPEIQQFFFFAILKLPVKAGVSNRVLIYECVQG